MLSPSSSEDPDRSGVKGNNHSLSPARKQAPLRKNHFITWFYKDLLTELDPVLERITQHCSKAFGQTELCPTTNRPHIHLMLWGKKKFRDTQLSLPKNSYRSETMQDIYNTSNYCHKDKSFDGQWRWQYPKPPYVEVLPQIRDWQQNIIDIIAQEPDKRTIYWFWEPNGGIGKTTFQKYLFSNFKGVVMLSGKSADMKNAIVSYKEKTGETPRTILIDIPRTFNSTYISYTGIEEIKNMYFYSGKYEGGMICDQCPHVIIFANIAPPISEDMMSADRWVVKHL